MAANAPNLRPIESRSLDDRVRGLGKQMTDQSIQFADFVGFGLVLAGGNESVANLIGVGDRVRCVDLYGAVIERHQHGINAIHAGA